jgi:hypothetical protein
MFIYQVPASPSTHRAYTWRKLKSLGALYLQNSICLLPAIGTLEEKLEALRSEIESRGGAVRLFHINFSEKGEEEKIFIQFKEQMDDEYGEFLDKCGDFHEELTKERRKRHLTFGELEENEVELNKLKLWLPKIMARDYFGTELRQKAEDSLHGCEEDFAVFEMEVEEEQHGATRDNSPIGTA